MPDVRHTRPRSLAVPLARGLTAGAAAAFSVALSLWACNDGLNRSGFEPIAAPVAGSYALTAELEEEVGDVTCAQSGTLVLEQTNFVLSGAVTRASACGGPEGPFDVTEELALRSGLLAPGDRISFADASCSYEGEFDADARCLPMRGTLACSLPGPGGETVRLLGTWTADRCAG